MSCPQPRNRLFCDLFSSFNSVIFLSLIRFGSKTASCHLLCFPSLILTAQFEFVLYCRCCCYALLLLLLLLFVRYVVRFLLTLFPLINRDLAVCPLFSPLRLAVVVLGRRIQMYFLRLQPRGWHVLLYMSKFGA